ncbi:Smr/MutS family protein [Candidatus Pelagibacter sp.]|nr:Smr/MutS family protein [Candidatus Pelagibacter sp.]
MDFDISDKDKKDWENFVLSEDKLPNKDLKLKQKKIFSTRSIDLHGYTLHNAHKACKEFISKSYADKINKLIIVTGKGLHSENEKNPYVSKDLSILKYSVPNYIKKNLDLMKLISEISDASIEDGGEGAFYIYLKKNNK